ncbi:hypothetical protein ING2E5A_2396 [Petrimonas mucosa]|uniref:Uncharacterized protein n=1 Tax=Petrimonas mucosa TaxID=1642646 RepID=A0A1G4G9M2_9BACT|nr:hypothetical protein ING2E5A_2396 [Petrimonas mucosa]
MAHIPCKQHGFWRADCYFSCILNILHPFIIELVIRLAILSIFLAIL